MSLSFVASAVQTATADGGFEETEINKEQVDAINKRNAHKPLFEQLRENQDDEQAKQEELQREMMRGTRALDEEDVAHLDALEKQRSERERSIQQRMQDELLLFRAAKAERQQVELEDENENGEEFASSLRVPSSADPPVAQNKSSVVVPKFVVKKRKQRVDPTQNEGVIQSSKKKPIPSIGLVGLLSGYGSSDDDTD